MLRPAAGKAARTRRGVPGREASFRVDIDKARQAVGSGLDQAGAQADDHDNQRDQQQTPSDSASRKIQVSSAAGEVR